MSVPPDNLTTKLAALTTTLGGKLDSILSKLDDLSAKLDASADYSAITSAITSAVSDVRGGSHTLTSLASRLDNIQAIAGSQNVNLMDILFAIGDIRTTPANYTVRALLSMLQTSLDTQPPENAGQNVPPGTEVCGPWIRSTSVAYAGTALISGVGYQAWSIIFPDTTVTPTTESVAYTIDSYADSAGVRPMRRYQRAYTTTGNGQVCLGWNTLGHGAPTYIASVEYTLMGLPSGWFWNLSQVGSAVLLPGEGPMPVSSGYSAPTATSSPPAWAAFDSAVEFLLLFDAETPSPDFNDYFISAKAIA